MNKYYITTAIAYTSKLPHIGNVYEAILADSIARYKRLKGFEVFFLTGTDEHGQKIQKVAEENNLSPKEHVDIISNGIKGIWDLMNISYDKFIRTTDDYHERSVSHIFKKLYEKGDIYKDKYEGLYCSPCESFYTPSQAPDGICPDCGAKLEKTSEEAYFFKLSKYQDRLIKYIEDNPDFIQPASRKNEMINNFLKPGLSDLCVSRSTFTWGIPVSFDNGHVIYVWIDALSNYITALGYDPEAPETELFKKNWPCDLHLIGKDILRFHTIYWPIMLMALDLPLPKKVFGHPWLLAGANKMSKSKGNVIYAEDLVHFFGTDAVRYFVLHEMPFAQDGTLSYELMIERFNSDLANILGNLVNRTLAMTDKYFGGVIPLPSSTEDVDNSLIETTKSVILEYYKKMDDLMIADAIDCVIALLRRSNKYIDETTPWILAKDESTKERLGTVLYNLLESIRISAILLRPFMPETSDKIKAQLNTDIFDFESLDTFGLLKQGEKIGEFSPLFVRIDEKIKMDEIKSFLEEKYTPKSNVKPFGEQISIDDFFKSDLRVAKVIKCENVPKSEKLLKFILFDGIAKRQVLSGIAKYYKPEELIDRNVIMVANLKPVKMMGLESCGMLLSAEDPDTGDIKLLFPEPSLKAGSKIG